MVRRKLQRDEWERPDTRPCFYKIIFPNLIHLRITHFFNKHLSSTEINRATLRSPCGNWEVQLLQEKDETYFGQGWQEFMKDHSLGNFEFLHFTYDGEMSFDVVIFDNDGCLKSYQESPSIFTSSFPFFVHTIKDYNVGQKCNMIIPQAFSRMHLQKTRQTMILRNSKGVSWLVKAIVNSCNQIMLSGGWKAFADDNSIKKGDACIFELVDQNTIQVRVFSEC